jgi:intracellular multiplication protein IcmL
MAGEELEIVRLKNDFYKDGFYKVFIALVMMAVAIFLLLCASLSLYLEKPAPLLFHTDNEGRVFPPVPLNQIYISNADLLQWTSKVLPAAFTFDFLNYNDELGALQQYFTKTGFQKLTDLLGTYANDKTIQDSKLFIQAVPSAVPSLFNQGLINDNAGGRYGWWISMPVDIHYTTADKAYTTPVNIQALVVRVPITNDLSGVAIDDILVSRPQQGGKSRTNG